MPGLVGYTDQLHKYDANMLLRMRRLLTHSDSYIDEDLYSDENIYASRTHLGLIKHGKQPYNLNNRFFLWKEGELYNQVELKSKYNVALARDVELLAAIYNLTKSFEFLSYIDGCYAAVLYDKKENKIYFITDRYGLKPLYWGKINNDLVWSSELKGFLGHKDFKINIDEKAVEQFFDVGYVLENRTWFDGIELVPPASILAFDIKKFKIEVQNYWSWSKIKPVKKPINEREIAEELGRLFKQSVSRRVNKNERIGVLLSGGLDSRAILAAVPDYYKPLHTFTFGQKGCGDVKIARKLASIKGSTHHVLQLNSSNWLMPRVGGVWKSDGALNLLDMHGMEFYDEYKSDIDFNLSGVFGGEIIGGQLVHINKPMEYKVRNQGRRFQNAAPIMGESKLIFRRVFFDNNLTELIFSIPEESTLSIYKKMLLNTFPEYYNKIPWSNTCCPISYPTQLVNLLKFKNRVVNKIKRESQRFGLRFRDLNSYTDYPNWIRQEPARSFFEKMLLSANAIYPEYVDGRKVERYLHGHMLNNANYHNELCLALTFEIWLQQIFEGRFR